MLLKRQIAPSMMCADALHLADALRSMEQGGVSYLHIDIMDGSFVPNYTLGTDYIKTLHRATSLPLDIHLMIERPDLKLSWFELRPGDYVSIHAESTPHIQRTLQQIRASGARPMLALNPATPLCALEEVLPDIDAVLLMTVNPGYAGQKLIPQTIEKIARLRAMLDGRGYERVEIEVDGNVSFVNAARMSAAGANLFVAGTASLFCGEISFAEALEKLRAAVEP